MSAERIVLPVAEVTPLHGRSRAWVLPLAALAFAAWLAWQTWGARGLSISVHAREAHGLEPGDALVYRGTEVGVVERVRLAAGLDGLLLEIRLAPEARGLARAGARFWIVRPHLALDSVEGLETVVGARYVAVLPGPLDAPRQDEFVALEDPPVGETLAPEGLEIVLEASERGGLAPGAPLSYRGVQIGSVVAAGLASDATSVEVRAYVRPAFAELVREDTRFWRAGGLDVRLGLGGLRAELGSLRSLIVGGIALATPTEPGPRVLTGHRFALAEEPEESWREWRPPLPIGDDLLPPGAPRPEPVRAQLSWEAGRFFARSHGRQGWLLRVEDGLLGPERLLVPENDARAESTRLEVLGESHALAGPPAWQEGGLALVRLAPRGAEVWPTVRLRRLAEPEDCLVVTDPATPPIAVAALRIAREDGRWTIDPAIPFEAEQEGAPVVARRDGSVVGLLLCAEGPARIAPVPHDGDSAGDAAR